MASVENVAKEIKKRKERFTRVDYANLNSLTSDVMYDTGRKPAGKFFGVDRIIERKKIVHNDVYLIKWTGWPLHACSWEPADHLTAELLRSYENPPMPEQYRLEKAGRNFSQAILTALKRKSVAPVDAVMDLDVQRYLWRGRGVVCEHRGCRLYQKEDFHRLTTLPKMWWYYLDIHGEGRAVDFPIKIKPVLSWTSAHYVFQNGQLKQARRSPIEKIKVHFSKKACSAETVL